MKKNRIFILLLILSMWFSTTGFQVEAQPTAAVEPAALAAASFGKSSPGDGATGVRTSGLVLSWSAVEGVSGVSYRYCLLASKNPRNKCPGGKWVNVGSRTSVTVNNLTADQTYYWWVKAYTGRTWLATADSTTQDGGRWSFKTMPLPGGFEKTGPGVDATEQVVNGLVLSWTPSSLVDSYEYCLDTMANTPPKCDTSWISVGNVLSTSVSGLSTNSRYYWQMRAVNNGGATQADGGIWRSFTTTILAGAFDKLSPGKGAQDMSITGLTLNWMVSQDAVSYQYCIGQDSQSCTNWQDPNPVTAINVTLGTLQYSTTYYWQVRAFKGGAYVEASDGLWSFTTQVPPPGSFNKISPGNGNTGISWDPALTWEPSSGSGITYEYCLYDTSPGVGAPCTDTDWLPVTGALSTEVLGLDPSTTYAWHVRAVNGTGKTESNGNYWNFTTAVVISPPTTYDQSFNFNEDATPYCKHTTG